MEAPKNREITEFGKFPNIIRKHTRHLYRRVENEYLLEYYWTLRGDRYRIAHTEFWYKQTPIWNTKPYVWKISDKDLQNYLILNS